MHAFREFVQREMDERAWKPADLVTASGLSKQVVSNLLNDDRDELRQRPSQPTVDGLAKAFHVQPELVLAKVGEAMGIPVETVVVYDASRVPNEELIRVLADRLKRVEVGSDVRSAPMNPAGGSPANGLEVPRRRKKKPDVPDTTGGERWWETDSAAARKGEPAHGPDADVGEESQAEEPEAGNEELE